VSPMVRMPVSTSMAQVVELKLEGKHTAEWRADKSRALNEANGVLVGGGQSELGEQNEGETKEAATNAHLPGRHSEQAWESAALLVRTGGSMHPYEPPLSHDISGSAVNTAGTTASSDTRAAPPREERKVMAEMHRRLSSVDGVGLGDTLQKALNTGDCQQDGEGFADGVVDAGDDGYDTSSMGSTTEGEADLDEGGNGAKHASPTMRLMPRIEDGGTREQVPALAASKKSRERPATTQTALQARLTQAVTSALDQKLHGDARPDPSTLATGGQERPTSPLYISRLAKSSMRCQACAQSASGMCDDCRRMFMTEGWGKKQGGASVAARPTIAAGTIQAGNADGKENTENGAAVWTESGGVAPGTEPSVRGLELKLAHIVSADGTRAEAGPSTPRSPQQIRWGGLFHSAMAHPANAAIKMKAFRRLFSMTVSSVRAQGSGPLWSATACDGPDPKVPLAALLKTVAETAHRGASVAPAPSVFGGGFDDPMSIRIGKAKGGSARKTRLPVASKLCSLFQSRLSHLLSAVVLVSNDRAHTQGSGGGRGEVGEDNTDVAGHAVRLEEWLKACAATLDAGINVAVVSRLTRKDITTHGTARAGRVGTAGRGGRGRRGGREDAPAAENTGGDRREEMVSDIVDVLVQRGVAMAKAVQVARAAMVQQNVSPGWEGKQRTTAVVPTVSGAVNFTASDHRRRPGPRPSSSHSSRRSYSNHEQESSIIDSFLQQIPNAHGTVGGHRSAAASSARGVGRAPPVDDDVFGACPGSVHGLSLYGGALPGSVGGGDLEVPRGSKEKGSGAETGRGGGAEGGHPLCPCSS
jgi:hypothetical protein